MYPEKVNFSISLSLINYLINSPLSSSASFTLFVSHSLPLFALLRNGDSQLFDKVRGHDIKLLRYLSVRYICDLMVENKKVKFGLK